LEDTGNSGIMSKFSRVEAHGSELGSSSGSMEISSWYYRDNGKSSNVVEVLDLVLDSNDLLSSGDSDVGDGGGSTEGIVGADGGVNIGGVFGNGGSKGQGDKSEHKQHLDKSIWTRELIQFK
jgi:hypothetical protein